MFYDDSLFVKSWLKILPFGFAMRAEIKLLVQQIITIYNFLHLTFPSSDILSKWTCDAFSNDFLITDLNSFGGTAVVRSFINT